MSTKVEFEVDMTLCLYQGRESWLKAVKEKYGKLGEKIAAHCAQVVCPEIETMDQVEKKTGKTIVAILNEAESRARQEAS